MRFWSTSCELSWLGLSLILSRHSFRPFFIFLSTCLWDSSQGMPNGGERTLSVCYITPGIFWPFLTLVSRYPFARNYRCVWICGVIVGAPRGWFCLLVFIDKILKNVFTKVWEFHDLSGKVNCKGLKRLENYLAFQKLSFYPFLFRTERLEKLFQSFSKLFFKKFVQKTKVFIIRTEIYNLLSKY